MVTRSGQGLLAVLVRAVGTVREGKGRDLLPRATRLMDSGLRTGNWDF